MTERMVITGDLKKIGELSISVVPWRYANMVDSLELRVQVRVNGQITEFRQIVQMDDFHSLFDLLMDKATREIRAEIMKV